MFGQNRNQLRQMYIDAWHKHQQGEAMQPLEQLIAEIIAMHPEYHALLEKGDATLDKDFHPGLGESNPFIHMGMHIAIREQLSTNRPAGIVPAVRDLLEKTGNAHQAEHLIMECLGKALWEAQQSGIDIDEQNYLHCVQQLST